MQGAVRGALIPATLAVLLVLPASSPAQRGTETLLDRVAVVVEGPTERDRQAEIATMFDLYVSANVELIRRAGPGAAELPVDLDAVRDAQRRAVEDLIALREAARLGRDVVSPTAVDDARDALAERIGGHEALREYLSARSVSLEAVDEALAEGLVVDQFTRDSVHLPTAVTPEDLRALFDAGGHPFVGRDFAEVEPEFEAWVRDQRFAEYRRLWLVDLRSRCRVAVFDVSGDWATPAPGGG